MRDCVKVLQIYVTVLMSLSRLMDQGSSARCTTRTVRAVLII